MALRPTEMGEDAGAGKHETRGIGDLVAGVLKQPEAVLQGSDVRMALFSTPLNFE